MSINLMRAVWKHGPANMTQQIVLLCLADRAKDDGTNVYYSMATIAKRCRCSRHTAIRAVNALVEGGFLERQRRLNDEGGNSSNLYTINVGRLMGSGNEEPPSSNEAPGGYENKPGGSASLLPNPLDSDPLSDPPTTTTEATAAPSPVDVGAGLDEFQKRGFMETRPVRQLAAELPADYLPGFIDAWYGRAKALQAARAATNRPIGDARAFAVSLMASSKGAYPEADDALDGKAAAEHPLAAAAYKIVADVVLEPERLNSAATGFSGNVSALVTITEEYGLERILEGMIDKNGRPRRAFIDYFTARYPALEGA